MKKLFLALDQKVFSWVAQGKTHPNLQKAQEFVATMDEEKKDLAKLLGLFLFFLPFLLMISLLWGMRSSLYSEIEDKTEFLEKAQWIKNTQKLLRNKSTASAVTSPQTDAALKSFLTNSIPGSANMNLEVIDFQAPLENSEVSVIVARLKIENIGPQELQNLLTALTQKLRAHIRSLDWRRRDQGDLIGELELSYLPRSS